MKISRYASYQCNGEKPPKLWIFISPTQWRDFDFEHNQNVIKDDDDEIINQHKTTIKVSSKLHLNLPGSR